ncbi:hypothetical protein GW17_00002544 [Ensete ventricosum]|nr:hypothetical protein GW17_00002544 [Ensete ventricosum]
MTIGASSVADVVVGGIVDSQRRRLSVGRGRRGQQEGKTTVEEGVTATEEGVVGGFSKLVLWIIGRQRWWLLSIGGRGRCSGSRGRHGCSGATSDIWGGSKAATRSSGCRWQGEAATVRSAVVVNANSKVGRDSRSNDSQQLRNQWLCGKKRKKMRVVARVWRDSTTDAEQEQGRTRNQQLRTSGGVPFLLEMLTARREGTVVVGKSGMLRSAASTGETAKAMAMAGCDAVDGSKGGCRGITAAICKGSLSMENHQIQSPYPIAPHSSTSSSCISNDVGVTEAAAPPTPPPTPKSIPRCMGATPCATTFVQADTSSFKQVVQLLTGSVETTAKRCGGLPPAAKAVTGPKRRAFKLYERRSNLKTIGTLKPTAVSPHRRPPEITSPSVLDFPSLALSPVTPLTPDPFDRHPDSDAGKSADARSIAEKGFYLHPSPRDAEPPRLLPLFPISSPRTSSASAACSST